jgi:hypothetical protein
MAAPINVTNANSINNPSDYINSYGTHNTYTNTPQGSAGSITGWLGGLLGSNTSSGQGYSTPISSSQYAQNGGNSFPKFNTNAPNESLSQAQGSFFGSTANPYLAEGIPGAPSANIKTDYQAPSLGDITGGTLQGYNSIMKTLNPEIQKGNSYINSGISGLEGQQGANTNLANSTIAGIKGMTAEQIGQLQNMYGHYTAGAANGMLAGQQGTEALMRSQQGANIGAVTASQGRSGFGSGIGQGDPFTQAEVSAHNQPYYQQLTNLNAQTQSQIGQMAANMAKSLGGNMTTLDANQTNAITSITNNLMTSNSGLANDIANLNVEKAKILQEYSSGALTAAQANEQLYVTNKSYVQRTNEMAQAAVATFNSSIYASKTSLQGVLAQTALGEQQIPVAQANATANLLGVAEKSHVPIQTLFGSINSYNPVSGSVNYGANPITSIAGG